MNPSDLYSNTLSSLTTARASMLSPAWQAALDTGTPAQRLAASRELIQVQQAILALSNASLADIANSLQQNETALTAATTALQTALNSINNIANVISSIASALQVVAKIVPLL